MSTILIIEEDGELRQGIVRFLQNKNYTTAEASNYKGLIDQIEDRIFDIIITNTEIKGGTVLDLIRVTKEKLPSTMIIVGTSLDKIDVAVQAIKEGAFGFIQKPINLEELRVKVEQAVDIKRLQIIRKEA